MKRLFLLIGLCLVYTSGTYSQKKKPTPPTIEQCLQQYDFDQAEELAKKELATLKRRRKETTDIEQTLSYIAKAKKMLRATERVVFIDSFVVKTADIIPSIKLSAESGKLTKYNSFFRQTTAAAEHATVFQSELGNKIYYSAPSQTGTLHLMTSDLLENKWSSPSVLTELSEENESQNYPFMLSDGITLYYSSTGPEGLGGYDIYITRYDSDEKSFLRPENVGMPFNSPADDYLLAIDELNKLGWLVSNRYQPEGQCCIYIFIPNETREVYNQEETAPEQLHRLARIASIAESWSDKSKVNKARQRFFASLSQKEPVDRKSDFEFIVNDHLIYTRAKDFRSATGKSMIGQWIEQQKQLKNNLKTLEQLRDTYIKADAKGKEQLKKQILALETQCETLQVSVHKQELEIRKAENQSLKQP